MLDLLYFRARIGPRQLRKPRFFLRRYMKNMHEAIDFAHTDEESNLRYLKPMRHLRGRTENQAVAEWRHGTNTCLQDPYMTHREPIKFFLRRLPSPI